MNRASKHEEDLAQQRVSPMTLFEFSYGVARSNHPDDVRCRVEEELTTKPACQAARP